MAQPIMREAVSEEEFELWDQGEPIPKRVSEPHEEPIGPSKTKVLKFDKIDLDKIVAAPRGRRKTLLNNEKVKFMGFTVSLTIEGSKKPTQGWMPEADYIKLKHELTYRDELNLKNME